MSYYYEVKYGGVWSPRKSSLKPYISEGLSCTRTKTIQIQPEHEHLSLEQLKEIYSVNKASEQEPRQGTGEIPGQEQVPP